MFIEFVRGVPLITVLFMASVMLPLFVPEPFAPDKLVRALIGVAMFASAYMAEVIWITVPDDTIAGVAEVLARSQEW